MFRKSRIKIITTIISVFLLLFIGTLLTLYFSNYREMLQKDVKMLKVYAQRYFENYNSVISDNEENISQNPLTTFNSIEFSKDNEVINIVNNNIRSVSDEYLINLAKHLLSQSKTSGINNNWVYYIEHKEDCTLVVLNYNIIMVNNTFTLLKYTILFGIIAILFIFIVSFYFARRIVYPLEEVYEKQKQFLSNASHELKTPIAIINTNAEILEREFGYSKWINNIKFETGRMTNLISQLLELTKTESISPQMLNLNFSRIVTGGTLVFECIAFEKECNLQLNVQDNIYIWGDSVQLGNLVSILLDNALEYAPKGSVITVSLKADRNKVIFSVKNIGDEIPEEEKKHLFERFYRIDKSRNGESGHYGLGLAIAKAIVTAHNGKIEVSCKENNVIFAVYLFKIHKYV